jgi:glucose-6-phosphate 1-dehydrogenase
MTEASVFTIFGAGGDLAWRKLVPALYNLYLDHWLPEHFAIIGVDRRTFSPDEFRQHLRQGVDQFSRQGKTNETQWAAFAQRIHFLSADFAAPATYQQLGEQMATHTQRWGCPATSLFYLAIAPTLIQTVVEGLGRAGLANDRQHARIVVEKPFGRDLTSAQVLNQRLTAVFDETQIYRIDHYLGKETVQNVLALRFANALFEPIWNRNYIDRVQITVAEEVGVEHRGGYYDQAGALRDIVQNHLLQILCLVAMEPPVVLQADEIRDKTVEVLRSIRPFPVDQIPQFAVRGQYAGYRSEPDVAANSTTETFTALKLFIDNWRWQDVPFYLRTGKKLARKVSVIDIRFRPVPHRAFPDAAVPDMTPNEMHIHIQPDEGIELHMQAKEPGPQLRLKPVDMRFRYREAFANQPLPEAYETLLLDVINGDATLFMRADQVEAAWRVVMPVLTAWSTTSDDLLSYAPGSWGPLVGVAFLPNVNKSDES